MDLCLFITINCTLQAGPCREKMPTLLVGLYFRESIRIESPQPFNITKNEKLTRIPLEPNDNKLGEVGLRRFSGEARISGELLLVALRGPSL